MTKMIYCLYIHDSHYRAVQLLAGYLSDHGHTVRMVDIGALFSQNANQPMETMESGSVVITAIGGGKLKKIFPYLKSKEMTVVSLFPGIIHHSRLEDLLGKWFSDLVLVNSLRDKKIYSLFCKIHGLKDNAHLFGCGWADLKNQDLLISSESYFVFIEQLGIPKTAAEAAYLLDQLDALAKRTAKRCVIKLRQSDGMSAPEMDGKSLWAGFNGTRHKNISFSSDALNKLLSKADFVLSVSSSALLQAILMKKPTFVISDFGRRNYYVDFFSGSKIIYNLKKLPKNISANPLWVKNNCTNPLATIDYIYVKMNELENKKREIKTSFIRTIIMIMYYIFIYGDIIFIPRFIRAYFNLVKPISVDRAGSLGRLA